MRFQGMEETDGWYKYGFCTTYRNGWENILAICRILCEYHEVKEIYAGNVKYTAEDLEQLRIPEASHICFRGRNKIYDDMPFQYEIYNQTDVFLMYMPKPYADSFKRSETEFLTEEEKKHTFDKFADSIEVNATVFMERRAAYDKLYSAFEYYKENKGNKENKENKENMTDGDSFVFRDERVSYECDLSKFF